MRGINTLFRAAVVLVAAAVGVALVPAAAQAASDMAVAQPFSADSGDACPYGYAKGVLVWNTTTVLPAPTLVPVAVWSVDVKAVVVDRPTVNDASRVCLDDRRYTVVTFTAYSANAVIDTEVVRVDNAQRDVGFTLGDLTYKRASIDLIVVQVCRTSLWVITGSVWPLPYDYCGKPQEYRLPIWT